MLSNSLRSRFLQFYANRHHTVVPSSPVFPHNDPTILFTNAGMNQFKNIFLNKEGVSYSRATTSQKCIRAGGKHNDLENVGHTSRHLTFFEMLGNFSFGDYFKSDAITFAWEVSLSVFNFDPDKIFVTVHEKDEEAFSLWERYLPSQRIFRLTDKDNFWSMADTGPCGYCSELLYDRGEEFGSAKNVLEDVNGERFLEYWNLVFMEFNRTSEGSLLTLPRKHIDTGAGLERLVSIISGSETVFETDVLRFLIGKVEQLSRRNYDPTEALGAAFRVIADHTRTLSFAIADGLLPGNSERGYVLRKILRRSVNYGKLLGFTDPFLAEVVPSLVEAMGEAYPELKLSLPLIQEVLTTEEENFFKTLRRGGNLLQQVLKSSASSSIISGNDAFKLKDTYGLPIDEIILLAKDHNYTVDMKTFHVLEQQAKELSKQSVAKTNKMGASFCEEAFQTVKSDFIGYDTTSCDSFIEAIFVNEQPSSELTEGDEGCIVLQTTPFYAEKGGQIGDSGEIFSSEGSFVVSHTISPAHNVIVHYGKLSQGRLKEKDAVTAQVNYARRIKIANNHTACHLLHKALETTLGEHIRQAGSYVDDTKLRLDFTHSKALSAQELTSIEDLVNEWIRENHSVQIQEVAYSEVMNSSEIKQFFGDKYGDIVRVVSAGASRELCGGTHAPATGNLGYFRIAKESSVSTGIRRIEAVTGKEAERVTQTDQQLIQEVSSLLQAPKDQLALKIGLILEERKALLKNITDLESQMVLIKVNSFSTPQLTEKGISYFIHYLPTEESHRLQQYATCMHEKYPHRLISLWISQKNGKYILLARLSNDLVDCGIQAQQLLQAVLSPYSGRWGGKLHSAQGSSSMLPEQEVLNEILLQWILTQYN